MKVLFLDDNLDRIAAAEKSFRKHELVVEMTADKTIVQLAAQVFDLVMLDHDLGQQAFVNSDREDCGMEVVRWIEKNHPPIKQVVVHSWNPVGRIMAERLQAAGYNASYQPFYPGSDYIASIL